MSIGTKARARNTPVAVATPLPPPLPRRKIGLTWPAIVKTPYTRAHSSGRSDSVYLGRKYTGRNPLRRSARNTTAPIFAPSTLTTFVAPRFPEPCFRRSTPRNFPARYADGTEPARYESRTPTIGDIYADFLRMMMRRGLPRNPHASRKLLCR